MNLQGSTVLITGGTNGIGLELARQLLSLNATVLITGRNQAKLDLVKSQFPRLHTMRSDVSKPQDIAQLAQYVKERFPTLNVLINNAGIMRNLNLVEATDDLEAITREIDINLSGTVRMVQQFLPQLKSQNEAAIVNISSSLAFVPFPVSPIYSATKAAIHAYTRVLRLQLGETAIRVFELAPPQTRTNLSDEFTDLDQDGSGPIMSVEDLVKAALKGILADTYLIRPGTAKVFHLLSRLAPDFILNQFDAALKRGKKKKARLTLSTAP